jgi:GDP-mannose transporter
MQPTSPTSKAVKDNNAWSGILSCLMYTFCSVFMVLSNKAISTTLPEKLKKDLPQLTVILFQCIVAVMLVEGAKFFKIVEYPAFNIKTARAWLPLNLLFIGMLVTGFLSLVYVSVPMVTVFKNLTNLVTVTGDVYIFKEE